VPNDSATPIRVPFVPQRVFLQLKRYKLLLRRRSGLPMELASITLEDRAQPTKRTRIGVAESCGPEELVAFLLFCVAPPPVYLLA